ncbi:MAG: dUTP diphosphatase [Pseudomonadota bacterium]
MREALTTMLRMQDRINTQVHPQWIEQSFAWHRAIWVECAELVDHYGYKWWKRQDHDLAQVQLEVVDIWHFGLSMLFTPGASPDVLAGEIEATWPDEVESLGVIDAAEKLAGTAALEKQFSLDAFASLLAAAALDFDSLFRQYLGKNVLNRFRQDHGYKDGSYRKQWQQREDNEHLTELLAEVDTDLADAEERLYAALARRYAEVA